MKHQRSGLFLAFLLTLPIPVTAADWPQWRGPGRDGRALEPGAPLGWGESGPPRLWERAAGPGFSPISVVEGRLYTAWVDEGDEVAVALEAGSGRELWRVRIDEAYENERGGGPRSTPTVMGDRLFLMSGRGKLLALSAGDGRTLWRRDLVEEYGAETPIWGFAASPLVVGERVVVPMGGAGQAVAAFAAADGALLWRAHDDAIGYSSPIVAELSQVPQVVALTGQTVSGISFDGELLWSHPWPVINNINIATPIWAGDDRVFVSTSYDVGAALLEVQRGESGWSVREVWRDRVMKNHFQDSVLWNGHLYGFDNAFLKAIVANTGEERWRRRGFGKGHLVLVENRLLVLGERGRLALLEATPEEYRELAAAELPAQRYWTPPTLVDGRLYVRTESEIFALDLRAARAAVEEASSAPVADLPEISAEELIRRNLSARGDEAAWKTAGVIRIAGRFNRNGRESRLTVWRQGERVRFQIDFAGLREILVFDGERGWLKPLREAQGALLEAPALARHLVEAATYLPPRDLWAGLSALEIVGSGTAGDEPVYRLAVAQGDWRQEWLVSARTDHLVETRRGVGEREFNTYLLDHRSVEGLVLPHYVEMSFGTGLYSLRVEEVEVGVEAPEDLFELPAAAKAGGGG